jgi:hypothetical protein
MPRCLARTTGRGDATRAQLRAVASSPPTRRTRRERARRRQLMPSVSTFLQFVASSAHGCRTLCGRLSLLQATRPRANARGAATLTDRRRAAVDPSKATCCVSARS